MKLLIDQNISHRVLPLLYGNFENIYHVKNLGLFNADDRSIFMFARENSYDAVITLDDDFIKLLNIFLLLPRLFG